MSVSSQRYSHVHPRARLCLNGRWLAVSEDGAILRIGVQGSTESEAVENFYLELEAWESLWTNPDEEPA